MVYMGGKQIIFRVVFDTSENNVLQTDHSFKINRNGYETRQTSKSKQRCQDLCWKVHDRAKSFVLRSYTMHELRNQHVSIG